MHLQHIENTNMYLALKEFDDFLQKKQYSPFTLQVVGGFALIVEGIKKTDFTDIDYIGKPFPKEMKEEIDRLGMKYGLGRGWINNDVVLSGNTLDDMECITGKLHFTDHLQMNVIRLDILDPIDVLKMKVIAVDTSYMGIELGGEFTRAKDFADIFAIMEKKNLTLDDLYDLTHDLVMCEDIYALFDYYDETRSTDFLLDGSYKELV